MEFVYPSAEIITEINPFKKIEMAGRTCYKSEKAITDDSAVGFFDRIAEHQHTAMMEHATFVFEVSSDIYCVGLVLKYINATRFDREDGSIRYLISGNLRAINESNFIPLIMVLADYDKRLAYKPYTKEQLEKMYKIYDDILGSEKRFCRLVSLNEYNDLSENEINNHLYTTMRLITDRGVTHEIVRHRPFSFAQESTRYVNYAKEKFGGGNIKFVYPAEFDSWNNEQKDLLKSSLENAETAYNAAIALGLSPQQARAMLPNAVKTEIIVTGNHEEWTHFFNLRHFGTTGAPHPDMKWLAGLAYEKYCEENANMMKK